MDRPDPRRWKWKAMQSIQATAKRGSPAARVRRAAGPLLALLLALVAALTAPAAASQPAEVIVLPGASSAEGITAAGDGIFYAGDFLRGDIFRGDIRRGTAEVFIDAPEGRMAVGMAADLPHHLLFVAGGFGQAHVYDTRTGATVASYQFADPATSIINDVAVTRRGAWFTDSLQAQLYFVPISRAGVPGPFHTLGLSGPAADTGGEFNLNGIQATPNGKTLIVAHSANGRALHGRPDHRFQCGHRRSQRAPGRWDRAGGGTSVGGADQQSGEQDPAAPRPWVRGGGADHHQRPVPVPDHRGPLRRSPGGGQRQVRHACRRTVRGGLGRRLTR